MLSVVRKKENGTRRDESDHTTVPGKDGNPGSPFRKIKPPTLHQGAHQSVRRSTKTPNPDPPMDLVQSHKNAVADIQPGCHEKSETDSNPNGVASLASFLGPLRRMRLLSVFGTNFCHACIRKWAYPKADPDWRPDADRLQSLRCLWPCHSRCPLPTTCRHPQDPRGRPSR